MKHIKYMVLGYSAVYNPETEETEQKETLAKMIIPYSAENEEIAKKEAYNGEYTIEDDGQPEPEQPMSDAERIAQLEEALELLLSGSVE